MKGAVAIRLYCDEPECEMHFLLEIPLAISSLNTDGAIRIYMPSIFEVPKGWRRENWRVLCPEHNPNPAGDKIVPTPDIVDRARKLQSLAMDKAAGEGERANAWTQFGKLWNKYELPAELGLEEKT